MSSAIDSVNKKGVTRLDANHARTGLWTEAIANFFDEGAEIVASVGHDLVEALPGEGHEEIEVELRKIGKEEKAREWFVWNTQISFYFRICAVLPRWLRCCSRK